MKRIRPLSGGFDAWRDRGYPVEEVFYEKSPKKEH
jgi:3-mercaptopyruvate sulfurtransferase SseA